MRAVQLEDVRSRFSSALAPVRGSMHATLEPFRDTVSACRRPQRATSPAPAPVLRCSALRCALLRVRARAVPVCQIMPRGCNRRGRAVARVSVCVCVSEFGVPDCVCCAARAVQFAGSHEAVASSDFSQRLRISMRA